jgi:hypothetical protein
LVTSNPSPAYLARVASVFNANASGVRGDLKAVFAAIWLDDEARNPQAIGQNGFGKLREPMLRQAQWFRSFMTAATRESCRIPDTSDPAGQLGQSPMRAPSVFNFFRPGYVPPATAMAQAGNTVPEFQIVNETSVSGYLNRLATLGNNGNYQATSYNNKSTGVFVAPTYLPVAADFAAELPLATDPTALIARLNLVLCAGRLSQATRTLITTALGTININPNTQDADKRRRVAAAVFMVMASPEYLVQK